MSKQDILKIIHQCVCDSFNLYENETSESFKSLLDLLMPFSGEQKTLLNTALFNYTMNVSETTCIAMVKALSEMGILDISEEDN